MFAVIYRLYLLEGEQARYQALWRQVANYFVSHRGAIGSCLHQAEEGLWVAYSRWPDKATRDAAWPGDDAPSEVLPEAIRQAIIDMKSCVDQTRKLPEIAMDVVDDLLVNMPSVSDT